MEIAAGVSFKKLQGVTEKKLPIAVANTHYEAIYFFIHVPMSFIHKYH